MMALSPGAFQQLDQAVERRRLGIAEVKDFVAEILPGAGLDAVQDVGDVGVIPRGRAVAENRDGPSGQR